MRVSNYHNNNDPVMELTRSILETGSDLIIGGNSRAHTSFLDMLESLIHFDRIRYVCMDNNGLEHKMTLSNVNANAYYDAMKFLLGRLNDRPVVNKFSIDADTVQDRLLTSTAASTEERSFKDVFILTNGEKFSFASGDEHCFNGVGQFTYFYVEVK